MKKIFFIKLLLFISTAVSAQSFPTIQYYSTIYTRNGTAVEAIKFYQLSLFDRLSALNYMQNNYPNATILENPTSEYNCYSYAFHLSEGNTQKFWINPYTQSAAPNLSKYWTDGSFIKVCNESDADKAHYYAGDHAALTTSSVSGQYESKWGANCRVIHSPTYCPYDPGLYRREYYASTRITGNVSNLCSGTRTFTVRNIPGATYSWTSSSMLTIVGATNTNQVTVQRNISGRGTAWVQVQITTPCSGTTAASTLYFPVGAPVTINMTSQGCSGEYQYWLLQANPTNHGSNWNWSVSYVGTNSQISIYSPSSPGTTVSVKGGGTVRLNYTDACGVSQQDGVTVYSTCYGGYYRVTASPNPAKNNINVSIAKEGAAKAASGATPNTSLRRMESAGKTIITIFDLYSQSPIKQWKQNEITGMNYNLDISGLRKGVYVLQVDRDNQTMVTKILVE